MEKKDKSPGVKVESKNAKTYEEEIEEAKKRAALAKFMKKQRR